MEEKLKLILNNFSNSIQNIKINNQFIEAIDLIKNCNGKIITTGMGKAGIAMRKFSSTLCSLGVPSIYLHPGEATHGDLGVIDKNDILFVASTSGKTLEIIKIVELSKNLNSNKIIGITSHSDSEIRKLADIIIDMGEIEEAGDLKLAPTTSILIMLAITDSLALLVSESKGFTKEEYSKRHHSGYLGSISREDSNIH
jgi:arabinose-5-phosphate isomerase